MRAELKLFLDWGIRFGKPYEIPEKAARPVAYANKKDLLQAIAKQHPRPMVRTGPISSKSENEMWMQKEPLPVLEEKSSKAHRGPYNLSKEEDNR